MRTYKPTGEHSNAAHTMASRLPAKTAPNGLTSDQCASYVFNTTVQPIN